MPEGRQLPNWIDAYLEYTKETESPILFNFWTALSVMAAATERKVYTRLKHTWVYTNLYVILVGPSGKVRKTTAQDIGRRILTRLPNIVLAADATSAEAIIKTMANLPQKEHQSVTALSRDLGTLFMTNPATMLEFLVNIHDCGTGWLKDSIIRGAENLTYPWFNLHGCTTPVWMGENIRVLASEGGFASRSIFVHASDRIIGRGWTDREETDDILESLLVNDLAYISTLGGEFRPEPDARAFYNDWYRNPRRFPEFEDPRTSSYFERKHVHAIKLAMLMHLAYDDKLVITKTDIEMALDLLDKTEPTMTRAFANVGKNLQATTTERILQQIRSVGGEIDLGLLLKKNLQDVNREELLRIVLDLQACGDIVFDPATKIVRSA